MKVALIPPIPNLEHWGTGRFHLCLSHLLGYPKYLQHYAIQRRNGAYIILDNSAHEFKKGETPEQLRKQMRILKPNEIVVPDVLENADETVNAAMSTMEIWCEGDDDPPTRTTLMYVPQGDSVNSWASCLQEQVRIHTYACAKYGLQKDFVIGLSKDYDELFYGGLTQLLKSYLQPLKWKMDERGIRMDVHLLGWSRLAWNLSIWSRDFPWIRSIDSAKPFVYGSAGVTLDPLAEYPPPYPGRRADYFTRAIGQYRKRIDVNIAIFEAMANGIQRGKI